MATNYSVFVKLNLSGATKINNDFKKITTTTKKISKEINLLNSKFKTFGNTSTTSSNKAVSNLKRIDISAIKASKAMSELDASMVMAKSGGIGGGSGFIGKEAKGLDGVTKSAGMASLAMGGLLPVLGAIGIGLGVKEVLEANDAWLTFTNTLKASGLQGEELANTQNTLYKMSQKIGVSIETTAEAYRQLKLSVGELGASQKDILTVTRALNEGIIQSGATAQQAKFGIMDLGHAFDIGKLQGRQYNELMSDFPAIGSKLKKAFLEASGGTESMRKQMLKGEISGKALFKALKLITPELDKMQKSMKHTSAQGISTVSNAFDKMVGSFSKAIHLSAILKYSFDGLNKALDLTSKYFDGLGKVLSTVGEAEKSYYKGIESIIKSVGGRLSTLANFKVGMDISIKPKLKLDESYKGNLDSILKNPLGSVLEPSIPIKLHLVPLSDDDLKKSGIGKTLTDIQAKSLRASENIKKANHGAVTESYNKLAQAFKSLHSLSSLSSATYATPFGKKKQQEVKTYTALVAKAVAEIKKTGSATTATTSSISTTGKTIIGLNSLIAKFKATQKANSSLAQSFEKTHTAMGVIENSSRSLFDKQLQQDIKNYNSLVQQASQELAKTGVESEKTKSKLAISGGDLTSWEKLDTQIKKVKAQYSLNNVLNSKNVGITVFGNQQHEAMKKYSDLLSEINEKTLKNGKLGEAMKGKLGVARSDIEKWQTFSNLLNTTANDMASSFANAVAQVATGSESASQAFKQMAKSIISDMIRMGIEKATLSAIMGLGKLIGGIGGASAGIPTGGYFVKPPIGNFSKTNGLSNLKIGNNNNSLTRTNRLLSVPLSNKPTHNIVINTNINHTSTGTQQQTGTHQQAMEHAKLISNMVSSSVKHELVKQLRVGGILSR